jgi:hypothetical protein
MKQLEEIKARASAAERGPWNVDAEEMTVRARTYGGEILYDRSGERRSDWVDYFAPTAEFIAAARTDVPKLVAALESVEDVLTWLDEIEALDPNPTTATGSHVRAGGVASIIRTAISDAWETA